MWLGDYEQWDVAAVIAFWINAYNAFTIRLILDHYPIASIRSIGLLPLAAFRERFIPMDGLKGGTISLNDIENDTLRSALSRAAHPLRPGMRLGAAVRRSAVRRIAAPTSIGSSTIRPASSCAIPTKNRVDPATRTLFLSSIFKWFSPDFTAAAGSVPAYVARYLDAGSDVADYQVEYLDYDWSLNDHEGGAP